MGLHEAVVSVADDMEAMAKDDVFFGGMLATVVRGWARQIRIAVMAAGGGSAAIKDECLHRPRGKGACSCLDSVRCGICGLCLACGKPSIGKLTVSGNWDGRDVAECEGGKSDGDMVPIDPSMPAGARMWLNGEAYELMGDGKLRLSEAGTDRMVSDD